MMKQKSTKCDYQLTDNIIGLVKRTNVNSITTE